MRKWNFPILSEARGFQCQGEPILFSNFFNFLTSILEGPILITPERGRVKILSEEEDFSAWGIQTGPFAPV